MEATTPTTTYEVLGPAMQHRRLAGTDDANPMPARPLRHQLARAESAFEALAEPPGDARPPSGGIAALMFAIASAKAELDAAARANREKSGDAASLLPFSM